MSKFSLQGKLIFPSSFYRKKTRLPIRTKKIKKTFEKYIKMERENLLFEDYFINSIIYN